MMISKKIDELKEELIQSTRDILMIKSVEGEPTKNAPLGKGVSEALDKALDICDKLGFKTVNMDGYVGYAEYGEGEEYIGILGHLDVVPEGDGWKYPPYAAEIHDGKIYARGALDDKGPIMAALYGLKAVKESNLSLTKKVRIIFGTNEETGSKDMDYYMKYEKPPIAGFTPDAEYPIIYAEKGATIFDIVKEIDVLEDESIKINYIKGGNRANMVPDYCEASISGLSYEWLTSHIEKFNQKEGLKVLLEQENENIIIKTYGVSAHGSTPERGKNAIMFMMDILSNIDISNNSLKKFISFVNKNISYDVYGRNFGVYLEDKASGKLSFNVGVINYNEGKIIMTLNLRYPVTFKLEDMMEPFKKTLMGTGIEIENFEEDKPLYFPPEHELIKTLQKVYKEQTGDEPKLLAIGGGTYAKEIPNIVAFGPIFPGKPDLDHQPNEYIEIDDLILNAKIYGNAIYELAK
ncbi:dipeptidase PepV [Clostridium algidicarnis]|nr:dipeptidase PepV [Clostridium algidicarnis]MBB6630886.1 dipeptidase PepV [Clostridium algidicarnis]MBB6696789.1 dipeptidase PepV [Clostridium algidicarnis]MBU3192736.1 dipeptidase PepV [Clostridium algidicarnis]MBU3204061.1 dipeptidase PepV [Clostridium algidicarnis]MBU3206807.1 dipeptidase PepV [Clostridium algidicarnis]